MIRAEDMDVQVEREGDAPGSEGAAVGMIAVAGCWDLPEEEIDEDPDCGASATFGDARGFLDFFDRVRRGDFPRLAALMREAHGPGDRVAVLDGSASRPRTAPTVAPASSGWPSSRRCGPSG
jgi:hypothetical protein